MLDAEIYWKINYLLFCLNTLSKLFCFYCFCIRIDKFYSTKRFIFVLKINKKSSKVVVDVFVVNK